MPLSTMAQSSIVGSHQCGRDPRVGLSRSKTGYQCKFPLAGQRTHRPQSYSWDSSRYIRRENGYKRRPNDVVDLIYLYSQQFQV